jgi:type VI secretion system secreted protein Hcp
MAASHAFMKIPNAEGEATTAGHEKEITLSTWSMTTRQDAAGALGVQSGGRGRPVFEGLDCTYVLDNSTPPAFKHLTMGERLDECVLTLMESATGSKDFTTVSLKECMITSLSLNHSDNSQVMVHMTLAANIVKLGYKQIDAKGKHQGVKEHGYNFSKSAAL